MAYIGNAASALNAAGYDPTLDFEATLVGSTVEIAWNHADPQPTEQQVNDWSTDAVALPSGQLFSEWQAENGGDPLKTNRRKAVEVVSSQEHVGVQVRALIELLNKRDNYLVNRIAELQDALVALQSSGSTPAARLNSLPSSYLATSTRPKSAAVTDYTDDINAGNQDA